MSIATELQTLNDNLLGAYNAIDGKSGTVPTNKNTANLATAISSIPAGGIGEVQSVTITNKADFENLSFSGTYLTIPLSVTVLPANAPQITQVVVTDTDMVHVLDNGDGTHSLHILKGGTCTVTVKDYSGTVTDSFTLTINVALEDISFAYSSLNVVEGSTRQLAVQFKPSTASNQTIVWSSSHESITVDQNGLVTANGTGSATISAYNAELDKTITCQIEVAAYVDSPDWNYVKAHKEDYGLGSEFTDELTFNNTTYTVKYLVVDTNYAVTKADGTSDTAMILMMEYVLPNGYPFSVESPTTCDATTEPTALADTYYYGKSGSTFTKLNLEVGDTLPYSDYDSIYKTGLNFTQNITSANITRTYTNRWDGSQIRAILNSDADNVSTAYSPVHITDRVTYTGKGFLQMINPDLVNVAETIQNTTLENNSCFAGGTYVTNDKFWLPSTRQMNGVPTNFGVPAASIDVEGEPFQYYVDQIGTASNGSATSRKFAQINSTSSYQPYWLRSAYYSGAGNEIDGNSDGSLNSNGAGSNYRFAAACAIC